MLGGCEPAEHLGYAVRAEALRPSIEFVHELAGPDALAVHRVEELLLEQSEEPLGARTVLSVWLLRLRRPPLLAISSSPRIGLRTTFSEPWAPSRGGCACTARQPCRQQALAFSTAPLAIASVLGLVLCVIALAFAAFVIVRAACFGDPVAGWPSLMAVILLIGGAQLLCLGIIGQYLAKTYLETKRRPKYLIRESGGSCL